MTAKNFLRCPVLTAAMAAVIAAAAPVFAAPAMVSPAEVAPVWRTDVTGVRAEHLPLISLVPGGQARSVRLTGIAPVQFFDFGVRDDDVVSQAVLELQYTPSSAIVPLTSQLNVYLNGRLQQSVPVPKEAIGKLSSVSIKINPKDVETHNQLSVEFTGRVQAACQDPTNDTLWLDVGAGSRLTLEKARIRLGNDLGEFPKPFIDTVSGRPTVLPVVFAATPSAKLKQAAAVTAGYVGTLTQWRGADFPVYIGQQPGDGHFVAFITNDARPEFLKNLPPAEGPEILMADAPGTLADKMLVVSGRNEDDLLAAVTALTRRGTVMIGSRHRVHAAALPEPRAAYDAPNWLTGDGTITFGKLMQFPGQLSASGYNMAPVHLPVRFAPDLFMTGDASVLLNVKYRASKPMNDEVAQFRAFVNGYMLDSEGVNSKDGFGEARRQIMMPQFYGALAKSDPSALAVTAVNDLSFTVEYQRAADNGPADNCKSVRLLSHRFEVEPSSTVEVKGLYHYAQLPDLNMFVKSGWPFTKYADLSQTAVLVADDAAPEEVTTMLNAVGRMAAISGAVPVRVTVTGDAASPVLAERDILTVGRVPLMMPEIDSNGAKDLQAAVTGLVKDKKGAPRAPEATVIADGIAAMVGAESPLKSGRSLVALMSEGSAGADLLNRRLVNPADLGTAEGSVVVLAGERAVGFDVGEHFTAGNLPWYHKLWMTLSAHPFWLVLCALLSAVMVGFAVFVFMRRWIGARG